MRLYTVCVNDKEYVSVENKAKKLVTLSSLGIEVSDMNELIKRFDEIKEIIIAKLDTGKELQNYKITADEIGDAHKLAIECFVNDEKRQSSNTACMITTVEEAISELSQGMTLKAGTVIATGTPGGVGMEFNPPRFLKRGDVVRCCIEGIGELRNIVG